MKTKFTQEQIDEYCKKYHIEKHYREAVYRIPNVCQDGIGDFLQKIRNLQEEFGDIEIWGDWYNNSPNVYKLIKKSKSDLTDEIRGRIREEEEQQMNDLNYTLETLRSFQKDYPELKITFEDDDND